MRLRRGTALVLLATLAVLPAARAGWDELSVPGVPQDVQMWGPNTFSVATTQGAFLFDGGVQMQQARVGEDVRGTFLSADGCLGAVDRATGTLSTTCSTATFVVGPNAQGMHHVGAGGPGYLTRSQTGIGETYLLPAGADPRVGADGGGVALLVDDFYLPTGVVGVAGWDGQPYALVAIESGPQANGNVRSYVGTRASPLVSVEGSGPVQALHLVPTAKGLRALLAGRDGLFTATLDGGTPHFAPLPLPSETQGVVALAVDGQAGGQGGASGFGFALRPDGGTASVLRAVPGPTVDAVGTAWVPAREPPPGSAAPTRVACFGAERCVLARPVAGPNNLLLYTNTAAPTFSVSAPDGGVREGEVAQLSVAGLVDADGDPVALRWRQVAPASPLLLRVAEGEGGSAEVDTGPLQVCGAPQMVRVQVEASDGLAAHVRTVEASVAVEASRHPDVVPAAPSVAAGGAPLPLMADAGSYEVCSPTGWEWRLVSGPGRLLSDGGAEALLVPPDALCTPGGEVALVVVEAVGAQGSALSTPAPVTVLPWGLPLPPFGGEGERAQQADSRAVYAPETHVCEAVEGFPGVTTHWALAGPALPGVRFFRADGGEADVVAGVDSPALQVEAGVCVQGSVSLDVVNRVDMSGGLAATDRLTVHVDAGLSGPLVPFEEGTLTLADVTAEGGMVQGQLSSNLECTGPRGIHARLAAGRAGEAPQTTAAGEPSGPFTLRLPASCAGGDFHLEATLVADDGGVGAQTAVDFRTGLTPARVGALADATLVARCEGGLSGQLSLLPVEGACTVADVTWTQREGPPLTASQLEGRTVDVQSAPDTPLSTLVGHPLVFDVTAQGGEGNSETRTLTVDVASERLVEVEERTQAPLAVEGEPVGLAVALRNGSSCALEGLSVHVRLRGLEAVAGSARVDGQPVAMRQEVEQVVLEGVALPAGGAAELALSATPGLYGQPAAAAEVRLNGVLVSREAVLPTEAAADGCGCRTSGPGPLGLLSVLLAGLARRRRASRLTARS